MYSSTRCGKCNRFGHSHEKCTKGKGLSKYEQDHARGIPKKTFNSFKEINKGKEYHEPKNYND